MSESIISAPDLSIAHVDAKQSPDLANRFQVEDERVWPELILFINENYQVSNDNKKRVVALNFKEFRYGGEISFDAIFNFLKGSFIRTIKYW